MMKNYLLILILGSIIHSFGQEFKKDMIALSNKMFKAKNISYKLHYNMYLDDNYLKPFQQRDINFAKSTPFNLYCSDGNNEIVCNKDGKLYISHNHKRIILSPQNAKLINQNEVIELIESKFDTLLMAYEKVNAKKLSEIIMQYECVLKAGEYSKIIVNYNISKNVLEKAWFHYRQPITISEKDNKSHKLVIELIYKDYHFEPALSSEYFSIKKYVKRNENKYFLAHSYSNYNLINLFENYENKNP